MNISVYDDIEKEIKQTDYYMREQFLVNVCSVVFCIVASTNVLLVMMYNKIGWITFAVEIIIFAVILYIIKFKLVYDISHIYVLAKDGSLEKIKRSDFLILKKSIE